MRVLRPLVVVSVLLSATSCGGTVVTHSSSESETPTPTPTSSTHPDAQFPPPEKDAGIPTPEAASTVEVGVAADAQSEVQASGCPSSPPVVAAPCAVDGLVCVYPAADSGPCGQHPGGRSLIWRCETDAWLEIAHCVDRALCPASPPADGTPCDCLGHDCFYEHNACESASIAQCHPSGWRSVNQCKPAAIDSCKVLRSIQVPNVPIGNQIADQRYPAVALAGTQMAVAWLRSDASAHDIAMSLVQTADPNPLMAGDYAVPGLSVGRDAVSNPALAFARDRFVLGWHANDGWPQSTTGIPGLFSRRIHLDLSAEGDVLIDSAAAGPSAVALGKTGGWIGYRTPAPSDPNKYTASLVALEAGDTPVEASKKVVADETFEAWYAEPIPHAIARVAVGPKGYVAAWPTPANGDFWDDSGFRVAFADFGTTSPAKDLLMSVGLVQQLSLAVLRDGTAVVAYLPKYAPPETAFQVVGCDESKCLPPYTVSTDELRGFGPVVVALDDGVALLWTTYLGGGGTVVHLHARLLTKDWKPVASFDRDVESVTPDERFAVAYSAVDRSLHILWSPTFLQPGEGDSILYQRLFCSEN